MYALSKVAFLIGLIFILVGTVLVREAIDGGLAKKWGLVGIWSIVIGSCLLGKAL